MKHSLIIIVASVISALAGYPTIALSEPLFVVQSEPSSQTTLLSGRPTSASPSCRLLHTPGEGLEFRSGDATVKVPDMAPSGLSAAVCRTSGQGLVAYLAKTDDERSALVVFSENPPRLDSVTVLTAQPVSNPLTLPGPECRFGIVLADGRLVIASDGEVLRSFESVVEPTHDVSERHRGIPFVVAGAYLVAGDDRHLTAVDSVSGRIERRSIRTPVVALLPGPETVVWVLGHRGTLSAYQPFGLPVSPVAAGLGVVATGLVPWVQPDQSERLVWGTTDGSIHLVEADDTVVTIRASAPLLDLLVADLQDDGNLQLVATLDDGTGLVVSPGELSARRFAAYTRPRMGALIVETDIDSPAWLELFASSRYSSRRHLVQVGSRSIHAEGAVIGRDLQVGPDGLGALSTRRVPHRWQVGAHDSPTPSDGFRVVGSRATVDTGGCTTALRSSTVSLPHGGFLLAMAVLVFFARSRRERGQ